MHTDHYSRSCFQNTFQDIPRIWADSVVQEIDLGCQNPWKLTWSKSAFSDLSNSQHCEELRLLKNFYSVKFLIFSGFLWESSSSVRPYSWWLFSPCTYQEFALLQFLFIVSPIFTVFIQAAWLHLLCFYLLHSWRQQLAVTRPSFIKNE